MTSEATVRTNPRREFIRHTVNVPLVVDAVSEEAGPVLEEGVNVSYGGLAFLSKACLDVGTLVRLRIPSLDPPFEAKARIAWCRPEGKKFLTGVQFIDSNDAFQSRMVQQVCSIENYRKEILEREERELTPQEAAAEWIEKFAGRFPDSETALPDGDDA